MHNKIIDLEADRSFQSLNEYFHNCSMNGGYLCNYVLSLDFKICPPFLAACSFRLCDNSRAVFFILGTSSASKIRAKCFHFTTMETGCGCNVCGFFCRVERVADHFSTSAVHQFAADEVVSLWSAATVSFEM